MNDIAAALKEFRQQNNLEQDDLARMLDTTQQTVSNWEKGTVPRAGALRRIAHMLRNYEGGKPLPPLPSKPVFDASITEIHEVAPGFQSPPDPPQLETTPRLSLHHQRQHAQNRFEQELEARLLANGVAFEQDARAQHAGVTFHADYLSERVCAEFRYLPAHVHFSFRFVDMGLFQLSTLRKIHRRSGQERDYYVLLLLYNVADGINTRILSRATALAMLDDIHTIVAHDPEQAAAALLDIETGRYFAAESDTEGDTSQW